MVHTHETPGATPGSATEYVHQSQAYKHRPTVGHQSKTGCVGSIPIATFLLDNLERALIFGGRGRR